MRKLYENLAADNGGQKVKLKNGKDILQRWKTLKADPKLDKTDKNMQRMIMILKRYYKKIIFT